MERELTLVFTMGRCGSSALFLGLDEAGCEPFHVHYLNPASVAKQQGREKKSGRSASENQRAREAVDAAEGPVRVVTLVRDAVERNLSAAWAVLRRSHPQDQWDEVLASPHRVADLWSGFHKGRPMAWFDSEVNGGLGIDVFAEPFPAEGHRRIQQGKVDLLVLRTDLPDAAKSSLVSDLVGRQVVVGRGRSGDQWGDRYARFKAAIPLEESHLREVARSRYMQHFFEIDEDAYVERWLGHRTPSSR